MNRAAPIFDGTADTFDCDLCGNAHPRMIPDDDGIRGGQGRDDAQIRTSADTILIVVGLLAIVAIGILAHTAIKAGRDASRVEASK